MDQSDIRTGLPVVVDLGVLDPLRSTCGWARKAFADVPNAPASLHRVEIEADAHTRYHRDHTEIYYVLECAVGAAMERNGEPVAVGLGSAVPIPPGVRHRAVGRMTILNVVVPSVGPDYEWLD